MFTLSSKKRIITWATIGFVLTALLLWGSYKLIPYFESVDLLTATVDLFSMTLIVSVYWGLGIRYFDRRRSPRN